MLMYALCMQTHVCHIYVLSSYVCYTFYTISASMRYVLCMNVRRMHLNQNVHCNLGKTGTVN
jgi:hypothetical protein